MEKKKTNRVRMYLMLSGLSILLIGCTQINESEENVSQLETEENDLTPERFFFQPDENVICVYEGTIEFDSINGFRVERDILYLTEITKTIVEG